PKKEEHAAMKYRRRPDLDTLTRVNIAIQAFLGLGVYGEITRIANYYRVSRLFVYLLVWQLEGLLEPEVCDPLVGQASRKDVDRHILLMRFEGRCSLESISQMIGQLGLPFSSVGYISQRLMAYARRLPKEVMEGAQILFLLSDEIFALGQPILMTVEPRSLAILKIELVENREAESWKKHWEELAAAGIVKHQTVVSDQGPGLVKGCALMGLTHHPDLFHLLRGLAIFGGKFYRRALAAITWEYERGGLEIGRSERVIKKRREAYEAAKADSEEKIRRYDNFTYLWTELRKALELCDSKGRIADLASRQAEIEAILELMRGLGCEKLNQEIESFAAGLEGYWSYYTRAEKVYQRLSQRYPQAVVEAMAYGWQLERQATNNKDYWVRKQVQEEAAFYYDYAASLLPGRSEAARKEIVEALEAEVRSSSLIENVNSALRPLLETCRGQVSQEMLELFAYVHNHRSFVRGKRTGKAPIEILTGKKMEKNWLESLLETACVS
ncbi:MAG: hypothetical protein L0312_12705, partial [Acidobacteria bacterium]|nr:hypothetical protein [Acidobacteriota bacterium]